MLAAESLQALTAQVTWLGPAAAFLAGLAAAVTPAYLPLASAVVGVMLGGRGPTGWRTLRLASALVVGMVAATATVGALFGAGGVALSRILVERLGLWYLLGAGFLLIAGLATLRVVPLRLPRLRWRPSPVNSLAGAFLLGVPFGLTTCPSCVPLLLPIAAGAAASGQAWFGAALFGSFTLGLGLPILILAGSAGRLGSVSRFAHLTPWLERAGGVLLLLAGFWFLYQFVNLSRM